MRFARSGAVYALANVLSAAVPFLLLPLLTRVLGPDEYGQVVSFSLIVTLCTTVCGLNAHAALGVVWFRSPRTEIASFTGMAIMLAISSTLIVALAVALVVWLAPFGLDVGLTPGWGATAALTAGANVILQCRLVLLQSQQRAIPSAVLQVAGSVLNVALSLFAVLVLGMGGSGRNAGIAAAAYVMVAVVIALLISSKEASWAPRRDHLKTLMAFGAPLIVHSTAAVLLGTADRWMISIRLGSSELGVYGAGAQLGTTMAILADAFLKAYSPWLYGRLASSDPHDKQYAVGAVYAAMPAFLVIASVVGLGLLWASSSILGPQYRSAAVVIPWFVLGGAFTGMYLCSSVLFFFSGRTSLLAMVSTSAAVVSVSVTWMLVSTLGLRGAAVGYATTQGILALFTTVMAMRSFDLPWRQPRRALTVWFQGVFGR